MRKTILFIITIITSTSISAQINNKMNALGFRVGYDDGLSGEISYQRYLNTSRNFRLESNLGYKDVDEAPTHIKFISTFQYIQPIFGKYNIYVGASSTSL